MLNDIDMITLRKKELKEELLIHQRKMLEIETELIVIENKLAQFSEMNIADNMVLSPQQKDIVESKEKKMKKTELIELTKVLMVDNMRELHDDTIVEMYEQQFETHLARY